MLSWIKGVFEHLKGLWGKVPDENKEEVFNKVVDAAAEMFKQFYRASNQTESTDEEKSNG